MQRIYMILGHAGLIPFVGLAIIAVTGWPPAQSMLMKYAALILTFLGGSVWMLAMQKQLHWSIAIVSNVVMLLAWVVFMLFPPNIGLLALAILFTSFLTFENQIMKPHYGEDYFRLRVILTIVAVLSLMLGGFPGGN